MRFVCDSCRAQYMISDEKVGPKGVKVKCKKCGYVILVKKADGAKAPVSSVGADQDDALATQVMQNPLGGPGETVPEGTHPGSADEKTVGGAPAGGIFSGVDEDEIGAVFDQVLSSGPHALPKELREDAKEAAPEGGASAGVDLGGDAEDRLSTRVLDAVTVQQLARESGGPVSGEASDAAPKDEAAPEWFVAIDEKQTGPLPMEKVRDHWSRGEIGPDSLCWKAGMADWVPISEVPELAAQLAPRPQKPVVVAPTPAITPGGAVVSVPVESAFSAGAGLSVAGGGQVQVALGAGEEVASWRPSAASALASLVKEEMEALSKPVSRATDPEPAAEAPRGGMGLLDLPGEESTSPAARANGHAAEVPSPVVSAPAPARSAGNPYVASPAATYSSPAISAYRPPPETDNKKLYVIVGAVAFCVTVIAIAIVLATRGGEPAPAQVVVQQPAPAVAPAPAAAPAAAPVAAAPAPAPVAAAPEAAPAAAPAPAVAAAPPPVAAAAPPPLVAPSRGSRLGGGGGGTRVAKAEPQEKSEPAPAAKKGGSDEFDELFGPGDGKKETPAPKAAESKSSKSTPYIPPAPGAGGDVKDELGNSDVMDVVLANKGGLAKCAEEQKKREPGVSGKLVMRWTIQTSGRTSNVGVSSDEFKSTYMAGCVGGLIKGWTFPRHKKQGKPVEFPFKF